MPDPITPYDPWWGWQEPPTQPPVEPSPTLGEGGAWWGLDPFGIQGTQAATYPAAQDRLRTFEWIVNHPDLTDQGKFTYIKNFHPDRLGEYLGILARDNPTLARKYEAQLQEEYLTGEVDAAKFAAYQAAGGTEFTTVEDWVAGGSPLQPTAAGEGVGYYTTLAAAEEAAKEMGPGYYGDFDPSSGTYILLRDPRYFEPTGAEAGEMYEPYGVDPYGGQGQWNPYRGQWEPPAEWVPQFEREQARIDEELARARLAQTGQGPQWRTGELELEQQALAQQAAYQTWQQQQAEREYGASLRAQGPGSWLEYASYTGQPPVIQPWMLPLMPQQYSNLTAGQPIPGWGGGMAMPQASWGGQTGAPYSMAQIESNLAAAPQLMAGSPEAQAWIQANPSGLTEYGYWDMMKRMAAGEYDADPERKQYLIERHNLPVAQQATVPQATTGTPTGMPTLTRPSRQYQARMGPTAMAQYGGYQQALTGATPQETNWRLWSMAPPGGRYGGLSYTR